MILIAILIIILTDEFTYYYSIFRLSIRYLILCIPPSAPYLSEGYKVEIGVGSKRFPLWAIILIAVASIAFISGIIIAIICIRKKRKPKSYISPLNNPSDNNEPIIANEPE